MSWDDLKDKGLDLSQAKPEQLEGLFKHIPEAELQVLLDQLAAVTQSNKQASQKWVEVMSLLQTAVGVGKIILA